MISTRAPENWSCQTSAADDQTQLTPELYSSCWIWGSTTKETQFLLVTSCLALEETFPPPKQGSVKPWWTGFYLAVTAPFISATASSPQHITGFRFFKFLFLSFPVRKVNYCQIEHSGQRTPCQQGDRVVSFCEGSYFTARQITLPVQSSAITVNNAQSLPKDRQYLTCPTFPTIPQTSAGS